MSDQTIKQSENQKVYVPMVVAAHVVDYLNEMPFDDSERTQTAEIISAMISKSSSHRRSFELKTTLWEGNTP